MPLLKPKTILSLSLLVLLVIIAVVLLMIVFRSRQGVKRKTVLYYAFGNLFFFALVMFLCDIMETDPVDTFIILQVVCLVLGTLHSIVLFKWFKWPKREGFWPEMLFTVFMMIVGIVGFLAVANWRGWVDYANLFSLAFLIFPIPFMVLKSFDYAWAIPPNIYKLWYYPSGTEVPNPMDYDLADHMKVIAFEFEPAEGKTRMNIKIKAPERMELGHYFMSFIEQYNLRNPEQPIEYFDAQNTPFGWLFFVRNKWYQSSKVFDAELTINDNNIKENDVIVVERVSY
ncbi:MAG: hypothetical protein IT223_03225 [Crocinitomicaceae bacterium]|nr:hypothetical protein [Crocinitomicaceae bacterium]